MTDPTDESAPEMDVEVMQNEDNDGDSPQQILIPLLQAAASNDAGTIQSLLSTKQHSNVERWMPALMAELLPSNSNVNVNSSSNSGSDRESSSSQPEQALWLVGTLASSDPERYLLPIAQHFARRISHLTTTNPSTTLSDISPALLQVWMQQLTQTSQVAVHSLLVQALVQAIQHQGPRLARPALEALVEVWKYHWNSIHNAPDTNNSNTNRNTASIVAVRCASTFCECLVALGDVAWVEGQRAGATDLTLQMLTQYDDPLLQLSILDLFLQHLFPSSGEQPGNVTASPSSTSSSSSSLQGSTQEWLTSPAMVQSILDMFSDPLLASSALECASGMATLSNGSHERTTQLQQRILQHIRETVGVTSYESDRLAVVHALVHLSTSAQNISLLESTILPDKSLRCCWWDITRISSPKLQAAILSSISQVLRSLAAAAAAASGDGDETASKVGLELYALLGKDNANQNSNTTDWLYAKYVKIPLPELRIATYAIWSAVAALTNGPTTLAATPTSCVLQHLLEGGRETTTEARVAKFDVLQTFTRHAQGFLAEPMQRKLEAQLELGPHGISANVRSWDVALE